jgi:tetratricopeptide (TPR) repeat protein
MKTIALLLAAALAAGTTAAAAADSSYTNAFNLPDKLSGARSLIGEKKWVAAIDELKRVNDAASADWNNLMGYTHRKAPAPDYAAAERYYDAALRIDPQHRGALEYSGELYLMTGDVARAEARLAALDQACKLPCDEYTQLKKAVAAHKAGPK